MNNPLSSIMEFFEKIFNYMINTKLTILRKNNVLISLPLWVCVIILILTWRFVFFVGLVSLFFGFRYFFETVDDNNYGY